MSWLHGREVAPVHGRNVDRSELLSCNDHRSVRPTKSWVPRDKGRHSRKPGPVGSVKLELLLPSKLFEEGNFSIVA